jgi:hypothetical protein
MSAWGHKDPPDVCTFFFTHEGSSSHLTTIVDLFRSLRFPQLFKGIPHADEVQPVLLHLRTSHFMKSSTSDDPSVEEVIPLS